MNILHKIKFRSWYDLSISFLKFSIVGIINTVVDFGTFTLLYGVLQLHYLPSQAAAYTAGVLNSYIGNKLWTFKNRSRKIRPQLLKFLMVNAVSLSASLIGLQLFSGYLGFNVYIVKICIIIITQMINYCGYRFWVFAKTQT